jgi:hypothetical protein
MKSLADQYGWFRLEAENLPPGVKVSLLGAIDCAEPRQAFLILNRLWERKELPAPWVPELESLYWLYCY